MKRFLADSNVALDLATFDPVWYPWSREQVGLAATAGQVFTRDAARYRTYFPSVELIVPARRVAVFRRASGPPRMEA